MKNIFTKKKFLILIIFLFLIPYPTISIPEWRLQVVDENENPLSNVEVFQDWTIGSNDYNQSDSKISDTQGHIFFPARKKIQPLSIRILFGMLNTISYFLMPHGSERKGRARVRSIEGSSLDWLNYYEGGELKTKLKVRK